MEWIEVPAHRVLKIDYRIFKRDFVQVNENGSPCSNGDRIYRIIRKSDSKMFMVPRWHCMAEDAGAWIFLQEID